MKRLAFLASALLAGIATLPALAAGPSTLRIIPVDTEGGAATLYVTPQGHSLLIDTGFPTRPARPGDPAPPPLANGAGRIVAAAKAAGLSRIDYVLITHYHLDHIGGMQDLMATFPVGTLLNHGPNREKIPPNERPEKILIDPETIYPPFVKLTANLPQRVMKPGETLKIDDLLISIVDSDANVPAKPLAGKGAPGVGCGTPTSPPDSDDGGEENARSLGMVATWGKARILALGDTTWAMENKLVCPRDLIGPVDMMMANNHGTANAGNPNLLYTVKPTVFVFNNGPRKGADAATLESVAGAPFVKGMWQLHFATRSPDKNAPADQIVNPDGPDAALPLQIAVDKDGTIAVTNPRTGATKSYPQAPGR
jgi:beta-lactamase superfamily II metal-dependent hydrolase